MPSSSHKKITFVIATVGLVLIAGFLIAELVIRIYHFTCDRQKFIWVPDDYLAYVHTPNNRFTFRYTEDKEIAVKHKTNSLGLLGEEISLEKPADIFRIIILGDSYTEALQVSSDQNFCGQLQALLNGHKSQRYKRVEVLNAGVSGYSPFNYYLYFQRELARLKPDMVIVQLFANDVFEDHTAKAKSLLGEQGLPLKTERYFTQKYLDDRHSWRKHFQADPWTYRLTKFFINKSCFLEYLYIKIINLRKVSAVHQKMIRMDEYGTGYQFFIVDPRHPLMKNEAFVQEAWGDTRKYLLALKKAVEHSQGRFLVFYIPMEGQLALERYGEHTQAYMMTNVGSYFDDLLQEFARGNNILFLDLLPQFKEHKEEGLYFYRDGHLTGPGHRLVAGTLFNYLQDHHLIP